MHSTWELTEIKEHEILTFTDSDRLIEDYLNEVKSFKLKLQIEDLKKKQNRFEKNGEIEESIRIAMELTKLSKELKRGERG